MITDRPKAALVAFIKSVFPSIDYLALYRARLIKQSGMTVDVVPDDQRLDGMSKIPLRVGIPGATMTVLPDAHLLVGWDGGDPTKPYATPIWDGGESVVNLTLTVTRDPKFPLIPALLQLGGDGLVNTPGPLNNGVVLGGGIDTFTGQPYSVLGNSSVSILAKKA